MAYDLEVKDYAKELFLTIDNDGNHKYSRRDIVEKITQKFPNLEKVPSDRLISTWSNTPDKTTKKSWVDLWEAGVRHGIQNAVKENDNNLDKDEEIVIQIDKIVGLRAGNAIKAAEKISQKLENDEDLTKDDCRLWRESERTFNNLNLEKKGGGAEPLEIDYAYLDEVDDDDPDEDLDEAE